MAASVWLYGTPITPEAREDVVTVGDVLLIIIDSAFIAVEEAASSTCTVKLYVPADTGVPERTPAESNISPEGKLPATIDQE